MVGRAWRYASACTARTCFRAAAQHDLAEAIQDVTLVILLVSLFVGIAFRPRAKRRPAGSRCCHSHGRIDHHGGARLHPGGKFHEMSAAEASKALAVVRDGEIVQVLVADLVVC